MTLHHSMKGCHVGKGGGTQLKLGSLWLLEMMALVDCDQKFLIIGEHFVLRLENFFQYLGSWIWDCSFFVSAACAPVFTILINVSEMFENTTCKKEKWPNARILYILKTNMATNTEKKMIDSQNFQQGFEWGWKRKAEWGVEWRRNPKTKCDRICERDRRSGSSLRLRDENTEIKNKTKSKLSHWWPLMSATALVLSGTNPSKMRIFLRAERKSWPRCWLRLIGKFSFNLLFLTIMQQRLVPRQLWKVLCSSFVEVGLSSSHIYNISHW